MRDLQGFAEQLKPATRKHSICNSAPARSPTEGAVPRAGGNAYSCLPMESTTPTEISGLNW